MTFLANFDPTSQVLTVHADPTVPDNVIRLTTSGSTLYVAVNRGTQAINLASVRSADGDLRRPWERRDRPAW